MLGALGRHGIQAIMTLEGATNGDVFLAYVTHVLAPTLRPGDIVVMDNLRAHKVAGVEQAITGCGARLVYLPPYSPESVAHRAVLVKAEGLPAQSPGTRPRGP